MSLRRNAICSSGCGEIPPTVLVYRDGHNEELTLFDHNSSIFEV
jgi:hypothetical protein